MIYISIGYNCSPRTYIKSQLRLMKRNGYLTCPFDLCVSPFNALYKCIETDFEFFFDELSLIAGLNAPGDRSLAGTGMLNITNSYGFVFNHEGPSHSHLFNKGTNDDSFYCKDNFKEFKLRYQRRIDNFKNYIINNERITFVVYYHLDVELDRLLLLLNTKYPNKTFTYIRI